MAKNKGKDGKTAPSRDDTYFEMAARAVRVCANYKPKFGTGRKAGLTLEEFQSLYRADPIYNWVGLDSPPTKPPAA